MILRGKYSKKPVKLFDAMTGKELDAEISGSQLTIRIPEFDFMAVVVAEYE